MKIAQLAPVAEPVPPKGYGGTELVVSHLTEELVKRGHDVVLFATGDSQTAAELVECAPYGLRAEKVPAHRWCAYDLRAIMKVIERQEEFDIVHNHIGYLALPFLDQFKCPVITTNHNPVLDYCAEVYITYGHQPFVAISDAYQRLNYPNEINYVGRVYNGINVNEFTQSDIVGGDEFRSKRDYLLFLGRISHAKGTAESIEIARAVGLPLKIAGKVDESDSEYYKQAVEPHIGKDNIEFIGEVSFDQKKELYLGAKAVIYPINFDEPFGLVMVEALACGTPLVALERGSVRELLSDPDTAIIESSVSRLIDRFPEVDKIKSSACIERAKLFSIERMTDGYLEIYQSLLDACEAKRVPIKTTA